MYRHTFSLCVVLLGDGESEMPDWFNHFVRPTKIDRGALFVTSLYSDTEESTLIQSLVLRLSNKISVISNMAISRLASLKLLELVWQYLLINRIKLVVNFADISNIQLFIHNVLCKLDESDSFRFVLNSIKSFEQSICKQFQSNCHSIFVTLRDKPVQRNIRASHSLKCCVQLQSTHIKVLTSIINALNLKSVFALSIRCNTFKIWNMRFAYQYNFQLYDSSIKFEDTQHFERSDTANLLLLSGSYSFFWCLICRQLQWHAFTYTINIYMIRIMYHFWQPSPLLDIHLFCWSYL